MGGHSIHFAEYVNRIHRTTGFVVKKTRKDRDKKSIKFEEPVLRKTDGGKKKWRRERDLNPRYTFKGRTIA
jgi:hypothetical protein